MRKVITAILLTTLLSIGGYADTHYDREATVTTVTDEVVTVVTTDGNEWEFSGCGFTVGETVTLKMDTNHTDNTNLDDKIIDVIK